MKQNILMVLFLTLTIAGCGKSGSVANNSGTSEIQTYVNLEDLKAALDKQKVVCGEQGLNCPSYSAKLAFWGKAENNRDYYLGVCSGTLYKGKYIITNSHCIPKDISWSGAQCEDQIKVLFPTVRFNFETSAKCKKIIQVYNPQKEQPDIAVIELTESVARDSIEIARDAFVEDSSVTAYTMNPDSSDNTLGTITKKTCTLSTDNAYLMNTGPSYGTGMIAGMNCDIIHGNSGSALTNKNGKMIAAVFARMEIPSLIKLLEKNKIFFRSNIPMGVVQNISCLRDITTNAGSRCQLSSPTSDDFSNYIERIKQAQNLAGVNDSQIEYELTANFKLRLSEVPFTLPSRDLTSFRDNWTKLFFNNTSTSSASKIFSRLNRK